MYCKNPPKKLLLKLRKLSKKESIITFHSLGDLDAICSALCLQIELGEKCIVAMQDRVNSQCKKVIDASLLKNVQKFSDAKRKFPKAKIILLDCNEKELLPAIEEQEVSILIDHHAKSKGSVSGEVEWINPQSSSVCQMISQIIKKPDALQAKLLLFGILSDSPNFANSTPQTFLSVSHLLKSADLEFSQVRDMLEIPKNSDSRIQILEGLRNISFAQKGGIICATAQVSSHESYVASILVSSGADCAFVASASKSNCSISARMRMEWVSHVPLVDIMDEVGKYLGGSGGGHPAAAGANGKYAHKTEEALALCQNRFFAHCVAKIKV